ncbi:MAG TPA: protease modulator HflC [Caulobacteraceae bacterium]|nr:protease modulator HflC [Caulobacteraceae bacterium]
MNRRPIVVVAVLLVAAAVLMANTLFTVGQRSQAIVLRFGRPVRVINALGENNPGLKVKAPWESVVRLDKRNQGLDADPAEIIAADQERLVVDAFLRYRITSPIAFYTSLGDDATAHDRLDRLISATLREVLGSANSPDIISGKRSQLMAQATAEVSAQAKAERLGIQVIDLRIKHADLPDANAEAVYQRMKTERQQIAAQIKAVGEQKKREIMAEADKEATVTIATADGDAARIRGDGDAQRALLFAKSFGRDPGFAAFYRTMQAYDASLGQGDTTFVLSPDSAFLKYLKTGPGAGR